MISRKMVRAAILGFAFLCMAFIHGVELREAQQFFFMLGCMVIFTMLIDNVWLTLFMFWTAFLFTFYKFNIGVVYLNNIFFGMVLYYATKQVFKKKHIDFFLDGLLWLCFLNLAYMVFQRFGWDFIYANHLSTINLTPIGFMGNPAMLSNFLVMCIPILARKNLWLSFILIVPIIVAHSAISAIAAVIVWMFLLFFKIENKWMFAVICIGLILFGALYLIFIDQPGHLRYELWFNALSDAAKHPVIGWGLDSFRNITPDKDFLYATPSHDLAGMVTKWDNPHCLFISLLFEWGAVGLILFIGYLRGIGLMFRNSIKTSNTVALAGVLLAVLVMSGAYFPLFLARQMVIIIPIAALFEIQTRT